MELLQTNLATLAEEGYEALLPLVHPDFEMETLPGLAAEPQVYRGPDGVRRWWESFYEVMDEIRLEPVEFHDVAPGRVIVDSVLRAIGQTSGVEVTQHVFLLIHIRDELIYRIEFFFALDEARAAVPD